MRNYAIMDSKGIIHDGDEEEMTRAFAVMTDPKGSKSKAWERTKWLDEVTIHGDLMLVKIIATHR